MLRPGFIAVYRTSDGGKQEIPAHWLDHPVLGRGFALTPSVRRAETPKASRKARR